MGQKLKDKDLFVVGTDANNKNLYWASVYVSGTEGPNGVYVSKRIREQDFITLITGSLPPIPTLTSQLTNDSGFITSSQNIATNNLVFSENSLTNLAGYKATFDNAEFKIIADANTSGDVPFEITQSDGTTSILKVTGDKHIDASFFKSGVRIGVVQFDVYTAGATCGFNLLALDGTYQQGKINGSNGLEFYSQGSVDGGLCAMSIDSGKFGLREFTVSSLPSVNNNTTGVKGVILVTDATPRPTICYSNGTNWIDIQTGVAVV